MEKNIKKTTRGLCYFAVAGVMIFLLSLTLFFYENQKNQDLVPQNTTLAGKDISLFSRSDFSKYIDELELLNKNVLIDFYVKDELFVENKSSFFGSLNDDHAWLEIISPRKLSFFSAYMYRLRGLISSHKVDPNILFDDIFVQDSFASILRSAHLAENFNGFASIQGIQLVIDYPIKEEYIDYKRESSLLRELYFSNEKEYHFSVMEKESGRSDDEFEKIKEQADRYLSGPIMLAYSRSGDSLFEKELSVKDISEFLQIRVPADVDQDMYFVINDLVFLEKIRDFYPKDASIEIIDSKIHIEKSRRGLDIDVSGTRKRFLDFSLEETKERRVSLVAHRIIDPELTTKEIEDLSIVEKVSSFTTYHSCCKARTENIQLMANILDGIVLAPGESLNINELVGERTEEKGFKAAPTIIKGHLTNTVGGGISQLITTLHNAVYWGGYELVAFKPHSIYFSRYPKGIEATINYPYVDYIFKNDTEYGVLVDTEYTDTSITVNLYGNNYGRSVSGDHRYGRTRVKVDGGTEQSRKIISSVSSSYNERDARIVYKKDRSLEKGDTILKQLGTKGWTVDVDRSVYQEGNVLHKDISKVNYLGSKDTIVLVSDCVTMDETDICK